MNPPNKLVEETSQIVMGKTRRISAERKCSTTKCDLDDQISKLPDDVLIAVLYLLTLKEAAVTSFLSRRWVHLWKFNARLDFDATKALHSVARDHSLLETERAKYIKWVNQVLREHQSSKIEEFRICFDLNEVNKLDIDDWIKFAFAKRVQRLELDVTKWVGSGTKKCYTFPNDFFLAQSITAPLSQIHPNQGGIISSALVDFKPLKTLCLKGLGVTGETLKSFLSNYPLLEHLLVDKSRELVNLEVSGRSLMLRSLVICHCCNLNSIKITNANLVSFKLMGWIKDREILLHDLPLLVEVYIGWFTRVEDVFSTLSCCLYNLEILTLLFTNQSKEYTEELLELPKLPRLKQLTLAILVEGVNSLFRIVSLVHAFPCLQKCEIQLWWLSPRRAYRKAEEIPNCPHECLKVVVLGGYYGRACDIDLAMYFLQNAVALEELIIDPHDQDYREFRLPKSIKKIEEENTSRNLAREQFKRIPIPASVKLKIL